MSMPDQDNTDDVQPESASAGEVVTEGETTEGETESDSEGESTEGASESDSESDDEEEEEDDEEEEEAATEPTVPPTMDEVLDSLEEQVMSVPIPTGDHAKAKQWIKDFREPLAGLGTLAFVDMLKGFSAGQSDEYLRGMYEALDPDELNAVIASNAENIMELAEGRVREAGIARMAKERLSTSMSSIVFQGLTKALLLI